MPNDRQSKSDYRARLAQNKGVKQGTRRVGRGGRVVREWNKKTARWEAVGPKGRQGLHGSVASFTPKNVSPPSSAGTAKTSSAGTFTESYKRSSRGQSTVPTFFAKVDQRRREKRRMTAAKKSGGMLGRTLKDYR